MEAEAILLKNRATPRLTLANLAKDSVLVASQLETEDRYPIFFLPETELSSSLSLSLIIIADTFGELICFCSFKFLASF